MRRPLRTDSDAAWCPEPRPVPQGVRGPYLTSEQTSSRIRWMPWDGRRPLVASSRTVAWLPPGSHACVVSRSLLHLRAQPHPSIDGIMWRGATGKLSDGFATVDHLEYPVDGNALSPASRMNDDEDAA